MPKRIFGDGQEIVQEDLNAISLAVLRDLYDRAVFELCEKKGNAFFGDSFLVTRVSATEVLVKKGTGILIDAAKVSPEPNKIPLSLVDDLSIEIDAADPVDARFDLIVVKSDYYEDVNGNRNYKDLTEDEITLQPFTLQQDFSSEFLVVKGEPDVAPVIPDVPAGFIAIASVYVEAMVGVQVDGIDDLRDVMPVNRHIEIDSSQMTVLSANRLEGLLKQVDQHLEMNGVERVSFVLPDNTANFDTGLQLNHVIAKSFNLIFFVVRSNDVEDRVSKIEHQCIFRPKDAEWVMFPAIENGEDAGVSFTLDVDGTIKASTTNMGGVGHLCQIYGKIERF